MVKQKFKGNGRRLGEPNDFLQAVKDIKKLTYESLSIKEKRIENRNSAYKKQNAKMPISMLKGIRSKALERHKKAEEEMREGQVFYDSSAKKYDLSWLEEKQAKKEKEKKKHEYNSYKFKGANSQGLGKYSNGVLTFSKNAIRKVSHSGPKPGGGKKFDGGKKFGGGKKLGGGKKSGGGKKFSGKK